jgi:hypothetical protein
VSDTSTEHFVTIRVEEDDTLKRYRVLTLALATVLTGRKLVRIIDADYDQGHIELVVEAQHIQPPPVPADFRVEVDSWPIASSV